MGGAETPKSPIASAAYAIESEMVKNCLFWGWSSINMRKTIEILALWELIKVLLPRNFHIFFPTVFLKNVKYRCKLREITMNSVRLYIFCLDITLQKSQKLVRHCFCLLYTSPSPRDLSTSRMPSSA